MKMRLPLLCLLCTVATLAFCQPPANLPFSAGSSTVPYGRLLDTTCVEVSVHTGWNMISNPFDHPIPDALARHLFWTLIGRVYTFLNGYVASDSMVKGRGYFGTFPGPATFRICGTGYTSDSVRIVTGWDMIGPVYYPVPVDSVYSIPPGIIGSKFFEFGPPLATVDTLRPGHGYWVRMLGSGLLVLPGGF